VGKLYGPDLTENHNLDSSLPMQRDLRKSTSRQFWKCCDSAYYVGLTCEFDGSFRAEGREAAWYDAAAAEFKPLIVVSAGRRADTEGRVVLQ
jgi:hypothetical protein